MRLNRVRWAVTALSLVFACRSALAADPPASVNFQRDVTYAKVGDEELKLNISVPKDAKGALPCIVIIHGGAWRAGHRDGHNDLTWKFAEQGYVSATVSYRFCPKYTFPAQVQDCKAAVRFLRANAEKYHIDPQRIGAVGFSAGAHLSMMLDVMDKEDGLDDVGDNQDQSSKVACAVSFFGPTDLTAKLPEASTPLVEAFVGGTQKEKNDVCKKASPITYIDKRDGPILLLQGTKDPLVPHEQAIFMVDVMTNAGVPGRVELLLGAGHGWGGTDLKRTAQETQEFFDQYLKNAKPATAAQPAAATPARGN
jgi:acetyl esterase/lipase